MSVYTDMEESIMDCWMVVDDLRAMAESEEAVPASLMMSFAQVYAFKFSRLAGLHEDALKEYYTLKEDSSIEEVDPFSVEEIGEMQW
jgi:hypothetical protein